MKNASKVMYLIGKIINIIEIVVASLLLASAIFVIGAPDQFVGKVDKITTVEEAKALGITLLVIAIVILIVSIVILVLANKAKKSLDNGATDNKPHIVMIVIGVLGGDIFYLLGGVFGVIAENKQE